MTRHSVSRIRRPHSHPPALTPGQGVFQLDFQHDTHRSQAATRSQTLSASHVSSDASTTGNRIAAFTATSRHSSQLGLKASRLRAPTVSGLQCGIAESIDDWDAAFRLLYERYLAKRLISSNPFRRRVLEYHCSPATNVFLARQQGEPVCTTTLIGDSRLGLPLEQLYPEEIEAKRVEGVQMAEVSCLAAVEAGRRSFHNLFMKLMRILGQHSRRFGIDELVVTVHPKHAPYYQRTMGFTQFGPVRSYRGLNNAPAVAIALNFHDTAVNRPPAYDLIFGQPLSLTEILPRPMPPKALAYFRPMVTRSQDCLPLFS